MPLPALRNFIRWEAAGGLLLLVGAALSMLISNSPWAELHAGALNARAAVIVGPLAIDKSVLLWINDGLMAVFFLLIGLELKREILEGQLSSKDQLALPIIGALGGFLVPAGIYALFNLDNPIALQGWAIPSATDIAFALGVLSLFGKRIPLSVKVFLVSLAIIDDLAAIVVIALFYTSTLSVTALGIASAGITLLILLNFFGVNRTAVYIVVGVVIWIAVLKSGVHATLAGVVVALTIPLRTADDSPSPLRKLEHSLHPWISFAILPLFAYANAGVQLNGITSDILFNPITLGIAVGLFLGKQIGVFVPIWLAIRSGIVSMPAGATWPMLYGVSLATGIGFTMSFFIGTLAFEDLDPSYAETMKLGVLGGSSLSMVFACLVLAYSVRKQPVHSGGGRLSG